MKQLFTFFSILACLYVQATVRTVSNSPITLAQFNTIQAAIDASSNGDTVYVHGSPAPYAGFTITNTRLTIIGPGWTPDKTLAFVASMNNVVNLNGTGTSGTEIQGLVLASTPVNIQANVSINNLRFIRNRFSNGANIQFGCCSATTYTGYLFEGNWFENSSVNGAYLANTFQNFLFQNNLFYVTDCCVGASITSFTTVINVLFDHNLWYGPSSGSRDCFASNCQFINLTNNIFVRRNAATSLSNSMFTNNITFNAGNNTPWASNGNVDVIGNVANTDPQMTDQIAVDAGTNNPLLDFSIATGPANNTGTDGKDMGLLFDATGSLNWLNSRNSRLPRIFSMSVVTPTVPAGGNVTIQVNARTSN